MEQPTKPLSAAQRKVLKVLYQSHPKAVTLESLLREVWWPAAVNGRRRTGTGHVLKTLQAFKLVMPTDDAQPTYYGLTKWGFTLAKECFGG